MRKYAIVCQKLCQKWNDFVQNAADQTYRRTEQFINRSNSALHQYCSSVHPTDGKWPLLRSCWEIIHRHFNSYVQSLRKLIQVTQILAIKITPTGAHKKLNSVPSNWFCLHFHCWIWSTPPFIGEFGCFRAYYWCLLAASLSKTNNCAPFCVALPLFLH